MLAERMPKERRTLTAPPIPPPPPPILRLCPRCIGRKPEAGFVGVLCGTCSRRTSTANLMQRREERRRAIFGDSR